MYILIQKILKLYSWSQKVFFNFDGEIEKNHQTLLLCIIREQGFFMHKTEKTPKYPQWMDGEVNGVGGDGKTWLFWLKKIL